jgi:hypothetical protein
MRLTVRWLRLRARQPDGTIVDWLTIPFPWLRRR